MPLFREILRIHEAINPKIIVLLRYQVFIATAEILIVVVLSEKNCPCRGKPLIYKTKPRRHGTRNLRRDYDFLNILLSELTKMGKLLFEMIINIFLFWVNQRLRCTFRFNESQIRVHLVPAGTFVFRLILNYRCLRPLTTLFSF